MKTIHSFIFEIMVLIMIPSCSTSEFTEKVVTLGRLGLTAAVIRGDIKSGDVVTIQKAVALIRSPGSSQDKLMALAELGIEEAIDRGELSPGDTLIIREAQAILKKPMGSAVESFDLTASK